MRSDALKSRAVYPSRWVYEMLQKLIIFVTIFVTCVSCGESKRAIENYSGDGIAKYVKRPGFLGIDGVSIEMPKFNMMKGLEIEYDLSGIPPGDPYMIYFVVPLITGKEETLLNKISKGDFELCIKQNGKVLKTFSSTLAGMTNNQFSRWVNSSGTNVRRIAINRFYDSSSDKSTYLSVNDSMDKWSILVTYTNQYIKEPIEAYILLERGGYK